MEINISQLHTLNMVTINGVVIENVTEYSVKSGRTGNAEITLTFKLPEVNYLELTALKSQE